MAHIFIQHGHQLLYGPGLIAGGLVVGDQFESTFHFLTPFQDCEQVFLFYHKVLPLYIAAGFKKKPSHQELI
jgi:hypothetical protein